jgi:hypothetical protein
MRQLSHARASGARGEEIRHGDPVRAITHAQDQIFAVALDQQVAVGGVR